MFTSTMPSSAHAAPPSMLHETAAKMLRAVLAFLTPTEEPIPPRHLQGMMALMRRADEIEATQPEVAAQLRWIASSYCYA